MSRRGSALPGAAWVRPWVQLVEITVSTPLVIAHRTARLVAGGWPPDARERRELTRMVGEKAQAFSRAAWAGVATPPKDTAQLVGNVLAPIRTTVVGNRRRMYGG